MNTYYLHNNNDEFITRYKLDLTLFSLERAWGWTISPASMFLVDPSKL